MAAIAAAPFLMRDAILTIDADSFETAVSSVMLTPSSSVVRFKGLTPTSLHTFATSAEWTCEITYSQDWETAGSLSNYLFANEGQTVSAVFEPVNGGASFAVELVITPGAVGGAVDSVATASVTLGVVGKPVITPAV